MRKVIPKEVSVIIPCKNEKEYIRRTITAMRDSQYGSLVEIIVVDDGSSDGCCEGLENLHPRLKVLRTPGRGVSYARNLGAKAAQGGILVFCDANLVPEDNWLKVILQVFEDPQVRVQAPYISNIKDPRTGGYGLTLNERLETVWLGKVTQITPVPILPSTCLAIYKDDYFQVGGFDEGFRVLGHEDVELSIRLWLQGYPLYINPHTRIHHVFRTVKPYDFSWEHYVYNVIRLACLHFNVQRLQKTLELFQGMGQFTRLVAETMLSDVWAKREKFLQSRKFDDDWYMARFHIKF